MLTVRNFLPCVFEASPAITNSSIFGHSFHRFKPANAVPSRHHMEMEMTVARMVRMIAGTAFIVMGTASFAHRKVTVRVQ